MRRLFHTREPAGARVTAIREAEKWRTRLRQWCTYTYIAAAGPLLFPRPEVQSNSKPELLLAVFPFISAETTIRDFKISFLLEWEIGVFLYAMVIVVTKY